MTMFSKISAPESETYKCYEVAHIWNPDCNQSFIDLFLDTAVSSSKVYAPFYLISILTKRKFLTADGLIKYFRDVITSSLFLSFNTSGFLSLFCFMRRMLGSYNRRASYLAAVIASYIAIKFERKNRRQALALYVTNVASETLFWMLHSRGCVKKIPYGDVFLMAFSSAVLILLYKQQKLKGVVPAVLNIILNKKSDQNNAKPKAATNVKSSSNILAFKMHRLSLYIHQLVQNHSHTKPLHEFILRVISKPKHNLCTHQNGCIYNSIKSGLQIFSIGYVGRLSLALGMNIIKKCFKTSWQLTAGLNYKNYAKFGSFLAGFVILYNSCDCLWRHLFGDDSSRQALASGFVAGLSIYMYRSPSIAVYLFWKMIEALWLQVLESHPNLNFPQGIELLYSMSTALLIYAGTLEAHNVRPAYIAFLKQITNNRFGMINRVLLDELSTTQKASKCFPYFPMVSDVGKTSSKYQDMVAKFESSGLIKYFV